AHELTDEQLSRLHELWDRRATHRNGISLVLGQQGNQNSLDFLTRNFDRIIDSGHEFESALAIGRLMMNYDISPVTQRSILRYAAVLEDEDIFRAYFYGLYRGGEVIDDPEMQKTIWETYEWTTIPEIKQYTLRILFNSDAEDTFERLNIENVSQMNVQLAVELAQHSGLLEWSDKLELLYAQLLDHPNPVVNEVALNQIKDHSGNNSNFDEVLKTKIVNNEEKEASIRLSGIMALNSPGNFLDLADSLSGDDVYLQSKKLSIYQKVISTDAYLNMLEEVVENEDRMRVLTAARALTVWWNELEESQKNSTQKEKVRNLIFELLDKGDRSVTYVMVPFMQSSDLVTNNDYELIEEFLSHYKLPEDVEVYQVFGGFLKEKFEKQSE
ncbi:MAG: hypothetical protein WD361_11570, partial [Gracilimonas sp.]